MAFQFCLELENAVSAVSFDRPVAPPAEMGKPASANKTTIWPGVVLAAIVAASAFSMRELPGLGIFSPMILAVIVGIVFANLVGLPANTRAGIAFCQRTLLRFAIVLLGFQLTVTQLGAIGLGGVAIVASSLLATFCFTLGLGRLLGVERKLTELIAAGTSICGASAIVATNAVTGASDEDVAYAVASVTLFGTIAMLGYPLLAITTGLHHRRPHAPHRRVPVGRDGGHHRRHPGGKEPGGQGALHRKRGGQHHRQAGASRLAGADGDSARRHGCTGQRR